MQLRNKIFAFFGALTMVLGGVGLYHALTNKGEAIEPDNIEYHVDTMLLHQVPLVVERSTFGLQG